MSNTVVILVYKAIPTKLTKRLILRRSSNQREGEAVVGVVVQALADEAIVISPIVPNKIHLLVHRLVDNAGAALR